MEKLNLKPLEAMVANKIHKSIVEQHEFIAKQDENIAECLIGDRHNGWNLRQNVQAGETGKEALKSLLKLFKDYVGVDHEEYLKHLKVEDKTQSVADKLMDAIKSAIGK
jgi:hypothetical protein